MGTIETKKDFDRKLTTNTAAGRLTQEDFLNWVADYYSGAVTEFILWDFSKADLSGITNEEFRNILKEVKKISHKRKGGKTAFVSKNDLGFGLGRMFEILAGIEDIQFEYMNFRSVSEARKWLGV